MGLKLGQNIKFLRKSRGLSQDDLAAELGISRSKVASYEGKGIEPRLSLLVKIAAFFDVSIDSLVTISLTGENEDGANLEIGKGKKALDVRELDLPLDKENGEVLSDFITKSSSIQKMLEGFKVFYNLKVKANREDNSPKVRELRRDIENILHLIDYLLSHNNTLMRALAQGKSNI